MKGIVTLILLALIFKVQANEFYWASEVKEVSSQRSAKLYSAQQVLGKPNVFPQGGETPCAWAPAKESNKKEEYIKVRFNHPEFIRQVVILENYNPGAIARVYVYSTSGDEVLIYENEKPSKAGVQRVWSHVFPNVTKHKVRDVKVVLKTNMVEGYNYIDAIGISASATPYEPAINLATTPLQSERENLGNTVNSEAYEFLPQISPDGKVLYFSRRDHASNTGNAEVDDIWFSKYVSGSWSEAQQIPAPINDQYSNSLYSITPDGNSVLLANVYQKESEPLPGVSSSYRLPNGRWAYPKKVEIPAFYNNGYYNEFFMASNRHVLLMTLDREEGYGDNDIYVSFLNKKNQWSPPKNLGELLNTAGVEASPFLAADNQTLYFSSNGFSGYGKQDIYMTKRLDDTWENWSEPINLGDKINSSENESYYSIPASGEYAYFVSSKKTLGRSDIFRIKLSEAVKPTPVSLVHGQVINGNTSEPMEADVYYELLPEGIISGVAHTGAGQEYKITLPQVHTYDVYAFRKGYFSQLEIVEKAEKGKYKELELNLKLYPVAPGTRVILRNVTFDQGKAEVLPSAYNELNRLVKIMKANDISIVLEGHTDNTGVAEWNEKLSLQRVEAVKAYLVSKGIKSSRIEVVGLGGEGALVQGSSSLNRRVELIVK